MVAKAGHPRAYPAFVTMLHPLNFITIYYHLITTVLQSITILFLPYYCPVCYNMCIVKLLHYPQEKLKNEILTIISKYLDASNYKVFVFGSRVAGSVWERSDIDIGIEGPEPVRRNVLVNIESELENLGTLYTIELVDFRSVSSDFRNVAMQKVEYIMQAI